MNVKDRERGARRRLCLRGFWTLFSERELEGLDSRRDKPGELCMNLEMGVLIGVTASTPGESRSSLCSLVSILWRMENGGLGWRHGARLYINETRVNFSDHSQV